VKYVFLGFIFFVMNFEIDIQDTKIGLLQLLMMLTKKVIEMNSSVTVIYSKIEKKIIRSYIHYFQFIFQKSSKWKNESEEIISSTYYFPRIILR